MIERIALSQGGRVTSVDPATNTIVTDFGNYTAAGRQCHSAAKGRPHRRDRGRRRPHRLVPDRSRDLCLETRAQHSRHRRCLHCRRHSEIGFRRERARPRPAPTAVASLIAGKTPPNAETDPAPATIRSRPATRSRSPASISPRTTCSPRSKPHTSPVDAPREVRAREADNAQAWFKTITVDAFG